ncbi:hypothetical protein [Mesorhizobium sp.]|uniref:hypothetical protein n=1 Tax=Mesorhizobium sp. TaxID=1871066 RepID=UPI0025B8C4B3|nr:hypothetical protein [Mesorhizobium sp.]
MKNNLYLVIGVLVAAVIALGIYVYREETKPKGVELRIDDSGAYQFRKTKPHIQVFRNTPAGITTFSRQAIRVTIPKWPNYGQIRALQRARV